MRVDYKICAIHGKHDNHGAGNRSDENKYGVSNTRKQSHERVVLICFSVSNLHSMDQHASIGFASFEILINDIYHNSSSSLQLKVTF